MDFGEVKTSFWFDSYVTREEADYKARDSANGPQTLFAASAVPSRNSRVHNLLRFVQRVTKLHVAVNDAY